MRTWEWIDKSAWGVGPWQSEPDKVQWTDEATGMPCLVVRHPTGGHFCGYVALPEGHPYYAKNYDDVPVRVHGGLTYGDFCWESDKEHGVCHMPEAGQPDRMYWLGFDCAHFQDRSPGVRVLSGFAAWQDDHYRDLAYVQGEVAQLAWQLATLVQESEAC